MANYIRAAFASKGDKEEIPFFPDGKTPMDFERGYPATYELDPDAGGEWIQRKHFNYIINQLSLALQETQRNGTRDWDKIIAQDGGYNVGESCLINYNPYTRKLTQTLPTEFNTESNYIQKIKIVSLINGNKTNPYDTNALYDTWLVDDGYSLGSLQIDSINHAEAPIGFLRVNLDKPDTQYSFNNFKRVRELLKNTEVGKNFGIFKKHSLDTFQFMDIRGHFMRTFSNGSTIDSARDFNALQSPALPNIKGVFGMSSRGFSNAVSGAFNIGKYHVTNALKEYFKDNLYNGDLFSGFDKLGFNNGVGCNFFNAAKSSEIYKDDPNEPSKSFNEVVPQNYAINVNVKV